MKFHKLIKNSIEKIYNFSHKKLIWMKLDSNILLCNKIFKDNLL